MTSTNPVETWQKEWIGLHERTTPIRCDKCRRSAHPVQDRPHCVCASPRFIVGQFPLWVVVEIMSQKEHLWSQMPRGDEEPLLREFWGADGHIVSLPRNENQAPVSFPSLH